MCPFLDVSQQKYTPFTVLFIQMGQTLPPVLILLVLVKIRHLGALSVITKTDNVNLDPSISWPQVTLREAPFINFTLGGSGPA